MALIQLDSAVPNVRPARLYRDSDELGREAVIVGRGDFGPAGKQPTLSDGRRRAVTNTIDDAGPLRLRLTFDEPPNGTHLEGVGAPGDSGGPLLILIGGEPHVAGVSSASMGGPPGAYGTRDVYARVSTAADWIDATIADPPQSNLQIPTPIDLTREALPDSPDANLIRAFFDALNSEQREQLIAFSKDHRLSGARRDRSDEDWADMMLQQRKQLGPLELRHLALDDRGRHQALARSPDGKHSWVFTLLVQRRDGPKLDGWAIRPGPTE